MQALHNPLVNLRYWVLISLVSILGTNTGDLMVRLYRQVGDTTHSGWFGLKHAGPLPLLIAAFFVVYLAERFDKHRHEIYFWTAIVIIRTAATNIADTLAGDLGISFWLLTGFFSSIVVYLALQWQRKRAQPVAPEFVPETNNIYWFTMLVAGVLGTIVGDELWHFFGLANSAGGVSILMGLLIYFGYRSFLGNTAAYWLGIVAARIAGTAVGDWLAKSTAAGGSGLSLESATLASVFIFALVAVCWRVRKNPPLVRSAEPTR